MQCFITVYIQPQNCRPSFLWFHVNLFPCGHSVWERETWSERCTDSRTPTQLCTTEALSPYRMSVRKSSSSADEEWSVNFTMMSEQRARMQHSLKHDDSSKACRKDEAALIFSVLGHVRGSDEGRCANVTEYTKWAVFERLNAHDRKEVKPGCRKEENIKDRFTSRRWGKKAPCKCWWYHYTGLSSLYGKDGKEGLHGDSRRKINQERCVCKHFMVALPQMQVLWTSHGCQL